MSIEPINIDPATVAHKIETLSRRIRTRSRILSGVGFAHGHNENPAQVAAFQAEQRAALDDFEAQLAYWEEIRDRHNATANETAAVVEYIVPRDPMEDMECDSCQ